MNTIAWGYRHDLKSDTSSYAPKENRTIPLTGTNEFLRSAALLFDLIGYLHEWPHLNIHTLLNLITRNNELDK